jgi:hypothetical protein
MAVRALSHPTVDRNVGGVWDILVDVRDSDGDLADDAPVVTVTLPDATTVTPAVETVTTGVYRAEYIPAVEGRFVAQAVTTSHGAADFVCYVSEVVANGDLPDAYAVQDYMGEESASWDLDEIDAALAAETAAQRRVCRVPAAYPPDLREALLRRVQVNLARRRQMTELPRGDGDVPELPPMVPPGRDPEIRRFEAPFRKLVMG